MKLYVKSRENEEESATLGTTTIKATEPFQDSISHHYEHDKLLNEGMYNSHPEIKLSLQNNLSLSLLLINEEQFSSNG